MSHGLMQRSVGEDEAGIASKVLADDQNDVRQRVASNIAAHKRVFEAKDPAEQESLQRTAADLGQKLAHLRHHRTACPSCQSTGLLQGETFGNEHVSHGDGEIVVRQSVAPTSFACSVCGLKLSGFSEIAAAGLSGHYTRTATFSPEEYYGLVDLDNLDIGELAMKWLSEQSPEYDND